MAEQIGLSLPVQSSEGIDEFYISDCNTMAVNLLEDWKNWPNLKHILSGPPASGKTHLGRIWAKQVNATYANARDLKINDIDNTIDKITTLLIVLNPYFSFFLPKEIL